MASHHTTTIPKRIATLLTRPHHHRPFTTTSKCLVNPLLNLSHFSASKEAQFFSREKKMPREEFYPYIELIRSSEVDPFAPTPGASPTVVAALKRAETGKSDMQTAYSLAIHNLIQQVQVARNEAVQAHATLSQLHHKYKRDERQSFLVMVTGIAALALILMKTDAVEDLKASARQATSQWKAFDWEWLGNPPAYKNPSRQSHIQSTESMSQLPPLSPIPSPPTMPHLTPIEAKLDHQATSSTTTLAQSQPTLQTHPALAQSPPPQRWTPSRLFWSSSS